MPVILFFNVQYLSFNETDLNARFCDPLPEKYFIMQLLAILGLILVPAIFILTFCFVLIRAIIKSKSRMSTFYTQKENETFKKDVELCIMAIVMNVLTFISYFSIVLFGYKTKNVSNDTFLFIFYIYITFKTIRVYFFLTFSSLFRNAFVSFIQKKKKQKKQMKKLNYLKRE